MECILKCGNPCTKSDTIGEQKWETLKNHSKKWIGLEPYSDIYNTTNWDTDRKSHYCHRTCLAKIAETKRLERKKLQYKKREEEELLKASGMSTC